MHIHSDVDGLEHNQGQTPAVIAIFRDNSKTDDVKSSDSCFFHFHITFIVHHVSNDRGCSQEFFWDPSALKKSDFLIPITGLHTNPVKLNSNTNRKLLPVF